MTKRIAAQIAEFLYSRVCDDPVSSLAFKKERDGFLAIGLSPEMKNACLRILEDSFDVRQLTLFPDIDGFCYWALQQRKMVIQWQKILIVSSP